MTIIDAIRDANLFQPFLGNLTTWQNWTVALRALYGHGVNPRHKELLSSCTGRDRIQLPRTGFDTALFLTGRRSGKSRIASIIAAFEAALAGHENRLARGEAGLVALVSPSKSQARIVRNYLRAIFQTPLLAAEVMGETKEGFELRSGIRVEILAGDFKTVRGYTLVACVADEVCFLGLDEEGKIRSDTELVRAIQPALLTTGGKLVAISTPYAPKGWAYRTWKANWGNDKGRVLVWRCPSRTMNATLPQHVIDAAMQEDLAGARSEYMAEWREDVCEFLPRSLIENLVVKGRKELLPKLTPPHAIAYSAFADLSGGRSDDATLAIGHRSERKVIIDKLCRYKPPHNPTDVIAKMCGELRQFNVRRVTGDNYSAEFTAGAFRGQGIAYQKSEKPKSGLYLELLPRLCSGEIELPDDDTLVSQLASLERRTRSGGRDSVDHGPNQHDDLANCVAGLATVCGHRTLALGALNLERSLA